MLNVPFKDLTPFVIQMSSVSLVFTRKDKGSAHDDRIIITSHSGSREFFDVLFRTPELKADRKFMASFSGVLRYLEDILTSMRCDTDPFECVQLLTNIHPSVLYHVSDMDESSNRDLILNMTGDALRFDVTAVPR